MKCEICGDNGAEQRDDHEPEPATLCDGCYQRDRESFPDAYPSDNGGEAEA